MTLDVKEMINWKDKTIAFDLDLTLTEDCVENFMDLSPREQQQRYMDLKPNKKMIDLLNKLSENNLVYIFTSRSDLLQDVTHKWIEKHNVKCRYFIMSKPGYDCLIDDKVCGVGDLKW